MGDQSFTHNYKSAIELRSFLPSSPFEARNTGLLEVRVDEQYVPLLCKFTGTSYFSVAVCGDFSVPLLSSLEAMNRWVMSDDILNTNERCGDILLLIHTQFIYSYVGRSMRSSIVKSTPENGLLFIRLSSWAFASRKWRIFSASFTLRYPYHI